MQRARLMLTRYRSERREAVRQYVGNHWSDEGTREKVPVNFISSFVNVVGRHLIANHPRVMLSTFERAHAPTVSIAEKWANKQIQQQKLADTMRRVVVDGMFSVGICKVALATPADAALVSWKMKAGFPFAERVDLDDFVFDIHARDFEEVSYIGHRYRAPLEVIRDSKIYSKERKNLAASSDNPYNLEGDERISTLGRGVYSGNLEEFEDFVDLWEVYLPRHRVVLTLADDQLTGAATVGNGGVGEALREQHWLGRDEGPYHMLAYGIVPGNAMPKAPVQDLVDLHDFANKNYRKLMRQTERQKENTFIQGGATEDGTRVMESNDGEIIRVDNPERIKTVTFGGPNQACLAIFQQTHDLFNRQAGNLDLLAGAAPQSRTLGQDKMLEANASSQVNEMQDRTVSFVGEVVKSLLWYWWHDPFTTMKSTYSAPGVPDIVIPRRAKPEHRQKIKWDDLDMKVDPYSMQPQTPQQRFQGLNQIVQQVLMPMMQLAQQQGIALDLHAYLEKAGKYLDQPDLQEILTIMNQSQAQQPQGGGGGGAAAGGMQKPANTTRTYERHSSGAASRYGTDLGRLNAMAPSQNGNGQQKPLGGAGQ